MDLCSVACNRYGRPMPDTDFSLDELLVHLHELAQESLPFWDLPPHAQVQLINVSENTTYLIEGDDHKAVLRIHRAGYHSRRAIESELAWIAALGRDGGVTTPGVYAGRDGGRIQIGRHPALSEPRYMVLFEFVEGATPDEANIVTSDFEELGTLAARCHNHVLRWKKPSDFERFAWDVEAVFGDAPTWGNWRDAPGVTSDVAGVLEHAERRIKERLTAFGKPEDRFNLIHADMRLANLLVDGTETRLIDFDDCGYGWFLYDFAAAISFFEDDPRIPELKAAWLRGYRTLRSLSDEEEREIDTFVMLRRMALLAWIGSHIEAPEPQALAPDFAIRTAALGKAWLQTA